MSADVHGVESEAWSVERALTKPDSQISKKTWCLTSTETVRLIREGERWKQREIIYLSLHYHHHNDSGQT